MRKHLFERQGFGPGPYSLVDVSECTTHTLAMERGQDLGFWPEAPRAAGSCDSCGQCIRYVYTLESGTGCRFRTGCDCVLKAFAEQLGDPVVRQVKRAASDFAAKAKRAGKVRRERIQKRARLRLFVSENRRAAVSILGDLREDHRIIRDIRAGLLRFGSLSEKQVALVVKLAAETRAKALEPAEVLVPVPDVNGRVRVSGEVVSCKWQENDYGGRLVMTVRVGDVATGAYLLWGSVPGGLADAADKLREFGKNQSTGEILRGRRVAFDAAVSRSDRETHFGFFKRPTKPELLA